MASYVYFQFKLDFVPKNLEHYKEEFMKRLNLNSEDEGVKVIFWPEKEILPGKYRTAFYEIFFGNYIFIISLDEPSFSLSVRFNDLRYEEFLDYISTHPYLQTLSARGYGDYYYDGVDDPFDYGFSTEIHPFNILTKEEADQYDYKIEDIPANFVKKTSTGGLIVSRGNKEFYDGPDTKELKAYFEKVKKQYNLENQGK